MYRSAKRRTYNARTQARCYSICARRLGQMARKFYWGCRRCTGQIILVFRAVDDIWQNKEGELIVVDYKATAKTVK